MSEQAPQTPPWSHQGSTPTHGRLAWPTPEQLSADRLEVYRAIVGGPRARSTAVFSSMDVDGRLEGPFNAMLVSPRIGLATQALGAAVRYQSFLSDRQREIAVLELAYLQRSDFEWFAHERLGLASGIDGDEIEALRTGNECPTFGDDEALIRRVIGELHERRDLEDDLFNEAVEVLGFERLADLVVLAGYYELLALSLNVWRTPLPDGAPRPWGP
jgi:4-carboxymuconolactone decarboxylase